MNLQARASKGGKARAAVLTPEERSASARRAVQARWAKAHARTPVIYNLTVEYPRGQTLGTHFIGAGRA